jgi:hypothetical protein
VKVTDPDGQTWRISRRWVPWRARLRDVSEAAEETAFFAGDPADIAIWICVFLISVLAPIVLSVLFLPLEIALVALVLPFAVLGRVLFGRTWRVEVRRDWKPWHEFLAGDWQTSTLKIHETADQIRRGDIPARSLHGLREDLSSPGDEKSSH